eukprot:6198976-Pleurochrysis_carterae.AAC.2
MTRKPHRFDWWLRYHRNLGICHVFVHVEVGAVAFSTQAKTLTWLGPLANTFIPSPSCSEQTPAEQARCACADVVEHADTRAYAGLKISATRISQDTPELLPLLDSDEFAGFVTVRRKHPVRSAPAASPDLHAHQPPASTPHPRGCTLSLTPTHALARARVFPTFSQHSATRPPSAPPPFNVKRAFLHSCPRAPCRSETRSGWLCDGEMRVVVRLRANVCVRVCVRTCPALVQMRGRGPQCRFVRVSVHA